jgi:PhnB protein
MLQTSPFILFDGNCREAMTFYQDCLGGELSLIRVGDTPMMEQFPVEKHNRIIYGQLKNDKIDLSATDWMASPVLEPKQGNTFSIYLTGDSYEELKPVFEKLAVGAHRDKRTFMELNNAPFGVYGQLTDKYSVSWIFRGMNQRGE